MPKKSGRAIDSLDLTQDFLAATSRSLTDAIEGQNGRRKEDSSGEGQTWVSQNSAVGTLMCQDRLRQTRQGLVNGPFARGLTPPVASSPKMSRIPGSERWGSPSGWVPYLECSPWSCGSIVVVQWFTARVWCGQLRLKGEMSMKRCRSDAWTARYL